MRRSKKTKKKTQTVICSEISGETTKGWGHDLGFTYLIFLKIKHHRREELWCRRWWLVKWTESFIGDVDKTTPSQSDCSPSRVRSYTVANLQLQVVSSIVGLDSMVACEGGRLGGLLWVLTATVARMGDWELKLVK